MTVKTLSKHTNIKFSSHRLVIHEIHFFYLYIYSSLKKILKNVNNKMRFNLINIYLKIYMQNFTTKLAWENRISPYNNFETKEIKYRMYKNQ